MAQLFNVIGFRFETSDWIDLNEEREQERRICDFVTTDRRDYPERKISATSREDQHEVHHGRIELDSHANTIVFGKNCVVLSFTGRECDVSPYTDMYDSIRSVPIAKAGKAWTSPESGTTFILVFNEGLWMGEKMDRTGTLVNPTRCVSLASRCKTIPFVSLSSTLWGRTLILCYLYRGRRLTSRQTLAHPQLKSCMIALTLFCRPSILGIHIA